ncbi:Nuclear receptor-binding protein 2 [Myotis brandtii]|uniref:Nuclear receptor-binding protein 2 n=1 Tax=Myotis brandtii TaxID=109478 RepID=S7PG68_MYOBR|nr:Nuclear receptor-binding protein 2 [Myotis brandtii]
MPGVQSTFLAMDTEEGVEVVWNELRFSDRKAFSAHEMAVLEIQANGDTRVTEEAIARARHSLSDPNMREFILSCLARDPAHRPSAHNLLFHRVLFEVHSLKLLAAHCFIQPQYSEVSCMELDKFLEDVRNGIYPLMNFAAARPLGLPRVLAPPPEEAQKAKTPTPEPFDSETRKVIQMQCNLERSEDKARWHDRLHRQLTYDLLPTDSAQDLAAELVHYGFLHEDDRTKLAAFLESTFLKYRGAQ